MIRWNLPVNSEWKEFLVCQDYFDNNLLFVQGKEFRKYMLECCAELGWPINSTVVESFNTEQEAVDFLKYKGISNVVVTKFGDLKQSTIN